MEEGTRVRREITNSVEGRTYGGPLTWAEPIGVRVGQGFRCMGGSRRLCADPDGNWLAKCAEPLDPIYDQTNDIMYMCVCACVCVCVCVRVCVCV